MSKGRKNLQQSQKEDIKLIEDFQADDSAAFDKLILKHMDMVFNLCFRILGDYDEANDSAQDIFIKVYKNLKNFRFKSAFSTWLYRVTINTCKNILVSSRHRFTKRAVRLNSPDEREDNPGVIDIRDRSFNPAVLYERKEKETAIQEAIDSLPDKQKILIILRDIEGKSYEEIVEITGFKPGTVKSKLARARQHLRDKLRGVL